MKMLSLADFGATADGVHDDTPALSRCFEEAGKHGGGTITIPPGDYFVAGATPVPLSSRLTVSAHGARFHLPERLGDRARIVLFSGTDVSDFSWHGGHFEGHCFDHRRPPNTWEPNVTTRVFAIGTSRGGVTRNLRFRDIQSHRIAGAVVHVEGVKREGSEREIDTFASDVWVQDCSLIDSGKFMWDYGLLWQILVWPEEYAAADVDMAWRYFRQHLMHRPVALADGDDRVRFNNGPDAIPVSRSESRDEAVCFLGSVLPRNIVRGRKYYVAESTSDFIRIAESFGGPALRFEGGAGGDAGLIWNLGQAFYHLFWPTGTGPGKGCIDLVACRNATLTGNHISALGDTMHLQACHNNVFANNQILGSRMGAFFIAEFCRNSTVTGNTVDGTNGSRVMSVEKSSEDVTIIGNTFRNGGRGSWINQPRGLILQGNIFVNNTTKGERDPWRGRKSFETGDYERWPEVYFTLHEPGGTYGPVIVRDNLFVTGPECREAIHFASGGHDIVVEGNVFTGPARTVTVEPGCARVQVGVNPGMQPVDGGH